MVSASPVYPGYTTKTITNSVPETSHNTLHNTYSDTHRQLRTPAIRPQYNAKYLPHARVQRQSAVSCKLPLPSSPFYPDKSTQLSPPSIFLSHDWPQTIQQYGDTDGLLKKSPHFWHDIQANTLGSPPLLHLMKTLTPEWWFSAHMHVRFEATYPHEKFTTKFLALDKCLKGREFLEVCLHAPLLLYTLLSWDPFE